MSLFGKSALGLSLVCKDRLSAVFTYQLCIECHVTMASVVPLLSELVFCREYDAVVWQCGNAII